MASNLLCYQLLLIALVLLCLLVHVALADSPPREPKTPLEPTPRRRRRTVDTQAYFCPDPDCSYYGRLGLGNLRANGHPGGKPWR